jgi:hypothetical protein
MPPERGARRRTTVAEAAEVLGISAEAVRGRIRRGTIPVEREGGMVYMLLENLVEARTTTDQPRTCTCRRSMVVHYPATDRRPLSARGAPNA